MARLGDVADHRTIIAGREGRSSAISNIDLARAAFERARSFLRAGDGVMTERLCRDALADSPGEPNLLSLLQLGRVEEAIDRLRRALELDPELQSAQLTLVHALTESGRAEQAGELMQTFLSADPARQLIAHAGLIEILDRQRRKNRQATLG